MHVQIELTDEQLDEIARRAAALLPTNPWLSVSEAAERMRCKPDRIYDLVALGKLQPRHDGRRVLLRVEDIDTYLENGGGT